jgi:hypothetical protein
MLYTEPIQGNRSKRRNGECCIRNLYRGTRGGTGNAERNLSHNMSSPQNVNFAQEDSGGEERGGPVRLYSTQCVESGGS